VLLVLAIPAIGAQEVSPERPELRVLEAPVPPSIDGRLDDPAWATAEPSDAFVQVDPREGEAPTERWIRALRRRSPLSMHPRC
jgi:hypothetical protein